MNPFIYNNGAGIVPPDAFRISASQISRFLDQTSAWYREFLLGELGFLGSTASELGNCVHAAAAMQITDNAINYDLIYDYINSITNPEVDKSILNEQCAPMISALYDQFLSTTRLTESETFLWHQTAPGVGVGGSTDAYFLHTGTIYDFKTTSAKSPPTSIPRAYWFQLMTYAYLYKQAGKPANYIEIVYVTRNETNRVSEVTGKPMKDYPSTVFRLREQVTTDNLLLIENVIKLITDSVIAWKAQPELRYLLAQDYRLKTAPPPILFKD